MSDTAPRTFFDSLFSPTFRKTTVWLRQLTIYLGWVLAVVVAYDEFGSGLGIENQIVIAVGASLPFLVTLFTDTLPALGQRRRERRLVDEGVHGVLKDPGYFRLKPYEEHDRQRYFRADHKHEEVFKWISNSESPLLYLTGRSGTGKSSLLSASVLPQLQEGQPTFRTVQVRSFQDPAYELIRGLQKAGEVWKQPPSKRETDPRKLLEKACTYLRPKRLLVVLDQFEEFVILHDADSTQRLTDLLRSLTTDPIPGLTILLARIFNLMFDIPTFQRPSASLFIGARAR